MIITKQQCLRESKRLAKALGLKLIIAKPEDKHRYYLEGKNYKIGFYSHSLIYDNLLSGYIENTLKANHITNTI